MITDEVIERLYSKTDLGFCRRFKWLLLCFQGLFVVGQIAGLMYLRVISALFPGGSISWNYINNRMN